MGMDYKYQGSASYPRFDRELCDVAAVFGGQKTEHLKERETTENERPFGYWFGFMSSDSSNEPKFIFPEGTNETLAKWFNDIYGDFDEEETKTIWEHVSKHPEIQNISHQIWDELETLAKLEDNWSIW